MKLTNTALMYASYGHPLHTLQLTSPESVELVEGQILVKTIYTPINPSDLIPITGAYSHRIQLPMVAGYEGVGIVADANGNDAKQLISKRVLPLRGQGTWQQYIVCNAKTAIVVPDFIPDHLAARAYINPLAAFLLLRQTSVVNQDVVVTAAGSQCAQLIAVWAKLQGAKNVYGITSTTSHHTLLDSLGVIPLLEDDPKSLHIIKNVTVVYDAVGGPLADKLLHHFTRPIQFYSYGLLSGRPITAYQTPTSPIRFHLRDAIAQASIDEWQQWFTTLWPLLQQVRSPEANIFTYRNWQKALTAFYQRDREFKPIVDWRD